MDKIMSLEKLKEAMDLGSQAKRARFYHNAKRLMRVYRSIMWCLENDISDVELQSAELGYEHIHQALELLACSMEDDAHIQRLQDQCKSMLFTRALILITDKALLIGVCLTAAILPRSKAHSINTNPFKRRCLCGCKKEGIYIGPEACE